MRTMQWIVYQCNCQYPFLGLETTNQAQKKYFKNRLLDVFMLHVAGLACIGIELGILVSSVDLQVVCFCSESC